MSCKAGDPDHMEEPVTCPECNGWCELQDMRVPDPDNESLDDQEVCTDCIAQYKNWLVTYHVDATGIYRVRARSKEEAEQKAENNFLPDWDNTELGDVIKTIECREAE